MLVRKEAKKKSAAIAAAVTGQLENEAMTLVLCAACRPTRRPAWLYPSIGEKATRVRGFLLNMALGPGAPSTPCLSPVYPRPPARTTGHFRAGSACELTGAERTATHSTVVHDPVRQLELDAGCCCCSRKTLCSGHHLSMSRPSNTMAVADDSAVFNRPNLSFIPRVLGSGLVVGIWPSLQTPCTKGEECPEYSQSRSMADEPIFNSRSSEKSLLIPMLVSKRLKTAEERIDSPSLGTSKIHTSSKNGTPSSFPTSYPLDPAPRARLPCTLPLSTGYTSSSRYRIPA
ncbi:hypothetical protein IWX50DRAFT_620526 [Phyllosticta citricarpa]|uniref:Uncharacterized protein n=1 Tax=Phyllosticta citricarpa TaxID=55181 RepID=A0ABR1L5P3_9PEZI